MSENLRAAAAAAATPTEPASAVEVIDQRPPIIQALTNPKERAEMKRALPPGLSEERFNRIALTAVKRDPQLLELGTTAEGLSSMIQAIHRCATMGLEPNSDLGHAYLIPFRMQGKLTLQFIIGYKGILAMARRSGNLKRLDIHEVYENDHFEYSYGVGGTLTHKPTLEAERGPIKCYYGYAEFSDGGYYYTVLTLADIQARRARSSNTSSKSPWNTDPVAMSKKSVARAMAPYLPLAAEAMEAIEADEKIIEADGTTSFIDVGTVDHKPWRDLDGDDEAQGQEPPAQAAPAPITASAQETPAPDGPEPDAQDGLLVEAGPEPAAEVDPGPEPEVDPGELPIDPPRPGCTCGVPGSTPPSKHKAKCALLA